MLGEGLRVEGEQVRSVHKPSELAGFVTALEQAVRGVRGGTSPVLIVTPLARRFVRQLVSRSSADPTVSRMAILSSEEIHPKARLKILGRV
jgi:flagellar biosynthesis component FlhA